MIGLLVTLFVFIVVFGLLFWALDLLPFAQPFKNVAKVMMILIAVVVLLGFLFGWAPLPYQHHPWMRG